MNKAPSNLDQKETDNDFEKLSQLALSRRQFLGASVAFGASAFVLNSNNAIAKPPSDINSFNFTAIAANSNDTVTVPDGYQWQTVVSWGDPLWSNGMPFRQRTRGTGASQELAFGDNNDGMAFFTQGSHKLLVVNNEYVNRDIFHGNRSSKKAENADDVRKSKAGHGISVCEIQQSADSWHIVKDSQFNRRITADTPIEITGPARGHALLKTAANPDGTLVLGTFNNCGKGQTPWGTYLACEENFNGNFASSDAHYPRDDAMKRYGIKNKGRGYNWEKHDERFDISKHPNEVNRFGYIVEINPNDPQSIPKKRTALGRFKHENAEVVIADNGHIVVYMGDDERGEFLYKFVSEDKYRAGEDTSELLNKGTLFVAKFDDKLNGQWIALTPESTGMASQAEICIHTRQAASAVGATTMDRPEWVAANPLNHDIYCCLTNNKNRGLKTNAGGDATPVGGPNPRKANNYGQIVRWTPNNNDHTATGFTWNLFVIAGNPLVHNDAYAGSSNINHDNLFNSPDGLAFDSKGMLWIQTDGKYNNKGDFEGMGNNQMLVGDPASGEIRRFLVGPLGCEITGLCWSDDRKTLFVGIQHPGEKGTGSHFPDGGDSVPRSSVVAITRNDQQTIG